MRTALLVLALLFPMAVIADDSPYRDMVADEIMDLSKKMATCAGRQEATAKLLESNGKPSNAEIARRLGKGFSQCAVYLRMVYHAKNGVPAQDGPSVAKNSEQEVAHEADLASLYLGAALERDEYDEAGRAMGECNALDDEALACIQDRKRVVGELRDRNQNATNRGQLEAPRANSGQP